MNLQGVPAKIIAISLALVFLIGSIPVTDADAETSDYSVLLDCGNGITDWVTQSGTGNVGDIITSSLDVVGVEVEIVSGTISVDGVTTTTVGSADSGGSYSDPGATGVMSTASWKVWKWDGAWVAADVTDVVTDTDLAISYGSSSYVPVETPEYRTSHVMYGSDSSQSHSLESGTQTVDTEAVTKWYDTGSAYAEMTYVQDRLIVKYGVGYSMGGVSDDKNARVVCYDYKSSDYENNVVWEFIYPGIDSYELTSPLIMGEHIYVPSATGYVFKFNWMTGPGTLQADGTYTEEVLMTDAGTGHSRVYDADDVDLGNFKMPSETVDLVGMRFYVGATSIIADSGVIYFNNSNGMTYCLDADLNLIWSFQSGGCIYFNPPMIKDDYVFFGSLDGYLHVLNKYTGALLDEEMVMQVTYNDKQYGSVAGISAFLENGVYKLIMSIGDGQGMSTKVSGFAIYNFNGASLEKVVVDTTSVGLVSSKFTPYESNTFKGVYLGSSNGIFSVDLGGNVRLLTDRIPTLKAAPALVDGEYLLAYPHSPGKGLYKVALDGTILQEMKGDNSVYNYAMCIPLVIGDWVFMPNDSGIVAKYGAFTDYVYVEPEEEPFWKAYIAPVGVVLGALAAVYCFLRFVKGQKHPFGYLAGLISNYIKGDDVTHNTRSRHRLLVMLLVGLTLSAIMFVVCICVGPTIILSPSEAISALFSSIAKGGENLTYNELMVYSSRLPRTIMAFVVGIGLSIAGVMYQAIIRNPLVDPYIMGVSSGAGTAAVAVIALNFTFFGLFSSHSIYLTAFAAMIGGVIAFAMTMVLAEKAGGTSINYVLAGVVVGLVFSAAQSIMLTTASENVSNSLTWLYGSFSSVSWEHVSVVFFPVLAMSLASLFWAKEFNLVLLGEDQAKQMGLNVKWFNRFMLILASVLTSLCVAFVGIIGFVGLVIPHLCRMILGGDHRLVMPASIAFGGFLLMFADLASRMLWAGMELPVGAITTIIGIPVFAWLLIKRGKMYDG